MEFEKPLYKKNSEGGIEIWQVETETSRGNPDFGQLIMTYGEHGGKLITKIVKVKGNTRCSAYEQTFKEAESKYKKKLKSGYVTSLEDALAGKTDDVIEGGVLPMLAQKFEDHKHKIKYPVYVQPKLDGHRCVAIFDKNGKVTLWTRTRKPIKAVPHIIRDLEKMNQRDLVLDGELYNHDMTFEEITSAAKKHSEKSDRLIYNIYDVVTSAGYEKRDSFLNELDYCFPLEAVTFVTSTRAEDEETILKLHEVFVSKGYEGAMVRQLGVGYEHKRSQQLLKVKAWMDDEFAILSVAPGEDDTVVFTVRLSGDKTNDVTMSGTKSDNQKYLQDESTWKDKQLTVKYFRLSADGKLMFPSGLRIREDL